MNIEKIITEITDLMDQAIEDFNNGVDSSQEKLFNKLETILKNEIEIKGSVIRPSVKNYKLIGKLRQEIINSILNKEYIDHLRKFIDAHDVIAGLIETYFRTMIEDYSPRMNDVVRKNLIETTINSLSEVGIGINIADPIRDILTTNITVGGNYSDLTKQLRDSLLTNEFGDGALVKYTKQITTDAINQYSAQYMQSIASDLEFEWFQYVGSNITTTRAFCNHLTEKRYVHISELPEILKGVIDGEKIPLNKQGIPYGMIEGTNETNFKIYRGGYNCRHQLYPISEVLVPANIVMEVKNSSAYQLWKAA